MLFGTESAARSSWVRYPELSGKVFNLQQIEHGVVQQGGRLPRGQFLEVVLRCFQWIGAYGLRGRQPGIPRLHAGSVVGGLAKAATGPPSPASA